MLHDLPLISTVAVSLSLALVCGLAATKLRISPIVGYLLVGILIGPHTPGFIANIKIAQELSEIGIVLLMFGVGLHFSVSDFMAVRKIALTGALVRIVIATVMGAGLSYFWGWPLQSGLIFGLALSVASTVVLLRAFEERNLLQTISGHITIGWLIVEDLAMVLAMVLIPALAETGKAGGALETAQQLGLALGKVLMFIAIMVVAGKRFLPWLLTTVSKTGSRELFTLAVFAVAMGIAFSATVLFGVSFALGAFFAGMMVRESDLTHEVADRALPFQDAFAVLFFVSVGMLFNPMVLIQQPLNVLAVVAVIMIGKSIVTLLIVTLFGYPLKTGLLISAGLAQIGEFSFILVTLGLSLGLLPDDGRDLILAGALVSIGLNPIAFYGSRLVYELVERAPRLSTLFNLRDDELAHLRNDEKRVLRELVILVGLGRVGEHITKNIHPNRVDLVVIDHNREKVESLRKSGFHAIAGDATRADVLHEAAIQKAFAIVVTVPDPFEARRIVDAARTLNPSIKVLVKAQNDEEMQYFTRRNIDLVVAAPREIGRRMIEYLNSIKSG
ncbi:MAG: Kef family K(+) transporter [Alphaproteobacteria bacterium]|nr:Kef family K(+) transporter [Alphaproteobacteria bacterium]